MQVRVDLLHDMILTQLPFVNVVFVLYVTITVSMSLACKLCAGSSNSLMPPSSECLHAVNVTCKFTFSIVVYTIRHTVVVLSLCEDLVKNFIIKGNLSEIPVRNTTEGNEIGSVGRINKN